MKGTCTYHDCSHVYIHGRVHFTGLLVSWGTHKQCRGIYSSAEWAKIAVILSRKKRREFVLFSLHHISDVSRVHLALFSLYWNYCLLDFLSSSRQILQQCLEIGWVLSLQSFPVHQTWLASHIIQCYTIHVNIIVYWLIWLLRKRLLLSLSRELLAIINCHNFQ
jgi:hypothetical protein